MSDSQCIRGGRFKRFKVERGCLGGNGFSLGSVDELKERRRCLPDYGKARSGKQVRDTLP